MSTFSGPSRGSPYPEPERFGWSQARSDDAEVVRLTGELDRQAAAGLRPTLLGVVESSSSATLVLDLSGLQFLDAGGARVLMRVCEAADSHGRQLRIDGLHGLPERVLGILGLTAMLTHRAEARDGVRGVRDGR